MRKSTLLMLGVLAFASAGCMNDVKPSDVGKRFTYDCSGLGNGWGDCTEKANAQCGAHNFIVVSQNGGAEGKDTGGTTQMKRTLVVTCK